MKNTTRQTGNAAECRAKDFLLQKGWTILAQNYRYKRGEIDIIASVGGVLVFVEVKYRKSNLFGYPEEFVDTHKANMVRKTAMSFVYKENWIHDIRFDIISITGGNDPEHFEDAF